MMTTTMQSIKSFIESADSKKEAKAWGLARTDYLLALQELKKCDAKDSEVKKIASDIDKKLITVNSELARLQFAKGKDAVENKIWKAAVDSLEEATRLAQDSDVEFLEEVKVWLDKARIGDRDASVKATGTPFVVRGDDFKENGNYGEAILEYQAAAEVFANLPEDHKFKKYVNKQLVECRRNIIRPYLAKADKAVHANRFTKAASLLKRALYLVENNDVVYHNFIQKLLDDIIPHLSEAEINEPEEFENQEVWEKAIKDYEEALDLYSSYSVADPFAPAYNGANIYEDQFAESRRQLGRLYKKRGDHLRDNNRVEKAIHNYKEAIKLLPKTDKLFHEAFTELKKLRVQVSMPDMK